MSVHLYIATPAYGCSVHTSYATSLMALQGLCIQKGWECSIDMIGNESLVQRARNILTARFLQSKATHLLFIDGDIAFRPEAVIDRLVPADKDVVTGVYAKKSIQWDRVRQKLLKGKDTGEESIEETGLDYNINVVSGEHQVQDGLVEVLDSATGFMLIKRKVIEDMYAHYADTLWCKNDVHGTSMVDSYCALFDCLIDPESKRYLSEDYAFVRRFQQMGGAIHADISFPLAHLGAHTFTGDLRERFTLKYSA